MGYIGVISKQIYGPFRPIDLFDTFFFKDRIEAARINENYECVVHDMPPTCRQWRSSSITVIGYTGPRTRQMQAI